MTPKRHTCVECFTDLFARGYIKEEGHLGDCDYCKTKNVHVIGPESLRGIFRAAIESGYEPVSDENTNFADYDDDCWREPGQSLDDIISSADVFQNYSDELFWAIVGKTAPGYGKDVPDGPDYDEFGQWTDRYLSYHTVGGEYRLEWDFFCGEVKNLSGKQLKRHPIHDLLDHALDNLGVVLPKGRKLFRARVNSQGMNHPFAPEMMGAPPPDKSKAGRCNIPGQAVLYTAEVESTAPEEVRSSASDIFTIAEVTTIDEVHIIDALAPMIPESFLAPNAVEVVRLRGLLDAFADELARPVHDPKDYKACQFLTKRIRKAGYDGLRHQSSKGAGHNIVLFDEKMTRIAATRLFP